jgi:hypothetical protein
MSRPKLTVFCELHRKRTIGKVMITANGLEWLMELNVHTGEKIMQVSRVSAWCPDCHAARWLDAQQLRDALSYSRHKLSADANGLLHYLD